MTGKTLTGIGYQIIEHNLTLI